MNTAKNILITLLVLCSVPGWTQHKDQESIDTVPEVASIRSFLMKGHTSGHIRNFLGSTINQGDLTNYWANATGGALHYETANYKGFVMGVKGIFSFNTASADMLAKDPITGKTAKWERELFDVNHPERKHDLDRLEELYIRYSNDVVFVELGKFDLDETPLLNRRDGRMKPFVFEGIWTEFGHRKNRFKLWMITRVSPRAMTEYFTMHEAVGLNNQGYQPNGIKAHYHEVLDPNMLGIFNYHHVFGDRLSIDLWEFYLDKLVNVNWFQVDYKSGNLFAGAQYVFEVAMPDQRDIDYEKRYYQPNEHANVIATRIGWKSDQWKLSANYLHSFATGRFVFPREFGRERLFTSMPRSWFEGLGNADVFTIKGRWTPENIRGLALKTGLTTVNSGGVDDYEFNKYGLRSYYQLNAFVDYRFHGALEGLEAELQYFLVRLKPGLEANPEYIINKANYHGLNLILNINF